MSGDGSRDGHEHDLVMPGFRFHPTEEELIEFYLRRKVEGKRFNIELIAFLDLYRYDPWELPALAAIGEKEWFFYVPRDRKYRNGDRPNRVTRSGYWKATGADRMVRGESSRSIGLKKTLVFYSGKAPKGIRTSWIMNEYRLPQSETDRYQKEISLCRVYKRSGIEDHSCPRKQSSSRGTGSDRKHNMGHQPSSPSIIGIAGDSSSPEMEKMHDDRKPTLPHARTAYGATAATGPLSSAALTEDGIPPRHSKIPGDFVPSCALPPSTSPPMAADTMVDELNRMVGCHQCYLNQPTQFLPLTLQPQLLSIDPLLNSWPNISDKLWEWNPLPEVGRD